MRLLKQLQQAYFCLGMFLIPAPFFLLFGAAAGLGGRFLWPLLAALGMGVLILKVPGRFRLPLVVFSMGLCFCLALFFGQGSAERPWVWVCAVLSALAAALYPRFLGGILAGGGTPMLWTFGLLTAGAVWFLGAVMPLPEAARMMEQFTWIYAVYLGFALTLGSLKDAAGPGRFSSAPMLLKNLGAALGWTGLFLLLTHLPAAARILKTILQACRNGLIWVFSALARLFPGEGLGGGPAGGGGMMPLPEESQPTSPVWLFLEKILKIVCAALIALVLLGLIYLLGKALLRGAKALSARLRAYMNAVSAGYDDQVESLLDWGEIRRSMTQRREKKKKTQEERVPWERLSPRQQVRRSYQAYLRRHPDIPDSRTARQALADPRQADIYEAARYSTHDITPQQAQDFRKLREESSSRRMDQ